MAKGAPQGNQYAKKAARRRGITVSHYIRADVLEVLRECIGDDEAIRKHVGSLIETAINQDMRRAIALLAQAQES